MYRQYEDPYRLGEQLQQARDAYEQARLAGEDTDTLIDMAMEIAELEERVNFAWQDNEYDYDSRDFEDELWIYENCY